jgi:ornithine--oxo-acid transaminase
MGSHRLTVTRMDHLMALEERHGAHNYHPLPVMLQRGSGTRVWDMDDKNYLDHLSAYSALSMGHAHPRIIAALVDQASRLSITSRSFYNDVLGEFEAFITGFFGYDKVLPMNTGGEAVETAIKLARRWGYERKGVPADQARVVVCSGNYHGPTLAVVSASSDPEMREGFGPFAAGFDTVPYDDIAAVERAIQHPHVVAFLLEPLQAEAGMVVPKSGYLGAVREACVANNVLLMMDEVQTGLGRTGLLLECWREGVKPDLVLLGKALGAGVYPVSAVLANDEVMLGIKSSGQHGSTYAGNPLGCRVAMTALEVLRDEGLDQRADRLGEVFRTSITDLSRQFPMIKEVRGRGLLNAVVLEPISAGSSAWNVCLRLRDHGLLAKPSHGDIIRFSPPLTITDAEMQESLEIIGSALEDVVQAEGGGHSPR